MIKDIIEIILVIIFLLSNIVVVSIKIENLILDPFNSLLIYSIAVLLIFITLYYIEKYYLYTLVLGLVISVLGIFLDVNNYFSHFLLVFYILLLLLKKQQCIDKYSSKVNIAKGVALIISAVLFFIVMKPSTFQQKYIEFLESNKFDQIMKKQIEYIINHVSYNNIIEQEIEKKKAEIIERFNNEKNKVKNLKIPENEKKELIKQLEEQLNQSLEQLEGEKSKLDNEMLNLFNESLSNVKSIFKEMLNNELILKAVTISLVVPLIGIINTILFYLSLFLSMLIDFLIGIFRKKEVTEEL